MTDTIHILSTRPLDNKLLSMARERDVVIDCVPFIDTEAVRDEALNCRVRLLAGQGLTVIFTSMNAVEAVHHMMGDARPSWKVYCIGAATRQLVERHFGADTVAGTADSASALADVIIDSGKELAPVIRPGDVPDAVTTPGDLPPVLFFCGDQRREDLPRKLAAAGIGLEELVVYRTIETPVSIAAGYDAIAFYSPSAVASFFSLNNVTPATRLFAIGTTTAAAIASYTDAPVTISSSPSKDAMIHEMIDHFQKHI